MSVATALAPGVAWNGYCSPNTRMQPPQNPPLAWLMTTEWAFGGAGIFWIRLLVLVSMGPIEEPPILGVLAITFSVLRSSAAVSGGLL